MSLLTDTDIEEILATDENEWERNEDIKREKLLIKGYQESSLTPVGYDLRVGQQYLKMGKRITAWNKLQDNCDLVILPDEMVAIETEEYIGMPQNRSYSGIFVSKVSVAEKGLSHISTSLDADYKGKLIITLSNESRKKVTLRKNQPFCTMILFKNKSPATRPCGKHPSEHIRSLLEEWQIVGKLLKRKIISFWIMKISIPILPLAWGLYINYFVRPISEAEAALIAALISLLFLILDRVLRTE